MIHTQSVKLGREFDVGGSRAWSGKQAFGGRVLVAIPLVCTVVLDTINSATRYNGTGSRRELTEDYAASGRKLEGTSRPGKGANTLTAEAHTSRCSSRPYLARSISTFFLAASFVQSRKHAEERDLMYSLNLASYARSRFLQIGQCIPAPLRRSAGPTVASIRSWFKLREISIKVVCSQAGGEKKKVSTFRGYTHHGERADGSALPGARRFLSGTSTGFWRGMRLLPHGN